MNKKLKVLLVLSCILIISGCGKSNEIKSDSSNENEDNKISCSINYNNGMYYHFINESSVCT